MCYINMQTGEIIKRKCRLGAYKYFKADGKVYGYKVGYKDIITLAKWQKLNAKVG